MTETTTKYGSVEGYNKLEKWLKQYQIWVILSSTKLHGIPLPLI